MRVASNQLSSTTLSQYVVVVLSTLACAPAVAGKLSDEPVVFKEAVLQEKLAESKPGEVKLPEVIAKAPVDQDFKKLDTNGDSRISLKEAVKDRNLAMQFDAIDVNHDGMISADEYAGYKASLAARGTDAVTPVTN
jgi:hypothetical protein